MTCAAKSESSGTGIGKTTGVSQEKALMMWAALQNAPSVLAATKSSSVSSAAVVGEHLLGFYHHDKVLMRSVHDLLTMCDFEEASSVEEGGRKGGSSGVSTSADTPSHCNSTSSMVSVNWLNKLTTWSAV